MLRFAHSWLNCTVRGFQTASTSSRLMLMEIRNFLYKQLIVTIIWVLKKHHPYPFVPPSDVYDRIQYVLYINKQVSGFYWKANLVLQNSLIFHLFVKNTQANIIHKGGVASSAEMGVKRHYVCLIIFFTLMSSLYRFTL